AGDPDKSLLIEAVRYKNEDLQMPPAGKLSDNEIADLERWIREGAADPRMQSTQVAVKQIDYAAGRNFWSFRPIANPTPPTVGNKTWPLGEIDRFILAPLEAKGLQPVAPADRNTWLRRVTYDLTGLPPTPAEIEAFLANGSSSAYEEVVDR